ncbi:MAG: kynureninase, partial [Candidatus Kariarchaeaceae archaeon]
MNTQFSVKEDVAKQLDSEDPLSKYRSHFYIPKNSIYFDGNSLGLLSKEAENSLLRVLTEWKTHGILGWFESEKPWFHYGERL